ncbi:MAG: hypothetical protein IJO48_03885 [Clostridia bacterium]|nr:hypothetical protein [Clostridia bacterium]
MINLIFNLVNRTAQNTLEYIKKTLYPIIKRMICNMQIGKANYMTFKKTLTAILSCSLTAAMLSACSIAGSGNAGHTHSPSDEWDRNAQQHWHACECGEKIDAADHSITDSVCSVCQSKIWDFDDSVEVCNYNEQGELIRSTLYDADGNASSDIRYEFEYNADNIRISTTVYENGRMIEKTEYATNADGESIAVKITNWLGDGLSVINEYDENGDVTAMYSYDEANKLTFEGHYEYSLTADGESYQSKLEEHDLTTDTKYACEYNEYEDILSRIFYNTDGTVKSSERYEYGYDENGKKLWCKTYTNDILTYEVVSYASGSDGESSWRYPKKAIEYYDDGTKLVSEYDEKGNPYIETYFKADGTTDRVLTYEYTLTSDGSYYKSKATEQFEDGTKTVSEYDENKELITQARYDADGNVIE